MAEVYKLSRAAPMRQQVLGAVADGLIALLGSGDSSSVLGALAQVGDALGLHAVFVAEHAPGAHTGPQFPHVWRRDGVDLGVQAMGSVWPREDNDAGEVRCLHPQASNDPKVSMLRQHGVRTLLTVPIMLGTTHWGDLGLVDLEAEQSWSEEVLSAVSAVAAAFGATLQRQRAFESVQRHAERIRSLHQITSRFGPDLVSQIEDALGLAARSLEHDLGVVVRIQEDSPNECELLHSFTQGQPLQPGGRFPVHGDFFGEGAQRPVTMWTADDPSDPFAHARGVRSYISTPIWVDGRPFGAVAFVRQTGSPRPYSQADQDFVQIVGSWIGSVLDQQAAEQRRADLERRLEHSRRLESLSVALGGIAHDFNNLLMVTATGLGLAEDALAAGDSELVPHLVQNARRATDRATELTGQLMTFAGRHDLVFEPTELDRVVSDCIDELGPELGTAIHLQREPGTTGSLPVDPKSVREVLRNVVINAHEACRDQPIRVRCGTAEFDGRPQAYFVTEQAPAGAYAYVEVEDAGPGIPEEHLRRVFEPFFTTKFAGRGLGLSEAVGVVRSHHGAIDVESTPGEGTRIRLLFPVTRPEDDAPEPRPREASSPTTGTEEHLLLVDDEDMLRSTLQQALELRGVKVDAAVHGADGLRQLQESPERFTAIVLDVTMPVMDGPEALRELRKSHPNLPVVLVSGYTEDNIGAGFASDEPTAFLQKPFGTTLLLTTISDLRRRLEE